MGTEQLSKDPSQATQGWWEVEPVPNKKSWYWVSLAAFLLHAKEIYALEMDSAIHQLVIIAMMRHLNMFSIEATIIQCKRNLK